MVTRTQEFYEAASIVVAQRTEVDGVTLLRSTKGRFYAESASQPGTLYLLTGLSCQCAGFAYRQTCRLHRALLTALGWTQEAPKRLPAPKKPAPKPAPAEPEPLTVRCGFCSGVGSHPGTVSTGPTSWTYTNVTCEDCHGLGVVMMPNAA
jgi:hypothetical protein